MKSQRFWQWHRKQSQNGACYCGASGPAFGRMLLAPKTSTAIQRKDKARSSRTATATNVIRGRSSRPVSIRAKPRPPRLTRMPYRTSLCHRRGTCARRGARRRAWSGRGAITGDAGTGAAAGAAMGGLAGGMRRRQQRLQQNQQQQVNTQAAANSKQGQRNTYHRAMAACLTGRGYTVN